MYFEKGSDTLKFANPKTGKLSKTELKIKPDPIHVEITIKKKSKDR